LVFLEGDDMQDSPSFLVYSHTVIEKPGGPSRPWEDITGLESDLLEEAARRGFDKQLHALGVHYA
jgi:hypothetical protein